MLLNLYNRRKNENTGVHALPCPHTSNAVWKGWNCISFPLFLMNFNLPGKHRNFELKNGRGRNHQVKSDPPFCCINNKNFNISDKTCNLAAGFNTGRLMCLL